MESVCIIFNMKGLRNMSPCCSFGDRRATRLPGFMHNSPLLLSLLPQYKLTAFQELKWSQKSAKLNVFILCTFKIDKKSLFYSLYTVPQKCIFLPRERARQKWDKRQRGKKTFSLHNAPVEGFSLQMCYHETRQSNPKMYFQVRTYVCGKTNSQKSSIQWNAEGGCVCKLYVQFWYQFFGNDADLMMLFFF